jgi:hypothetical protein
MARNPALAAEEFAGTLAGTCRMFRRRRSEVCSNPSIPLVDALLLVLTTGFRHFHGAYLLLSILTVFCQPNYLRRAHDQDI